MTRFALLLVALAWASATWSESPGPDVPMSEAAFDANVTGRTVTYSDGAGGIGIERYARDRRVIWQSNGGECLEGTWYAEGAQICFLYGGPEDPHCWLFFAGPKGLTAISQPGGGVLTEVPGAKSPLICPEFGS